MKEKTNEALSLNNGLSNEIPEIGDLQSLISGCNKAVVTYGLCEVMGHPEKMEMCKMVILYNSNQLDMDTVRVGSNRIMMCHTVSMIKNTLFSLVDGIIKKSRFVFKPELYRNIFGFAPNNQIHDMRDLSNEYKKGRV